MQRHVGLLWFLMSKLSCFWLFSHLFSLQCLSRVQFDTLLRPLSVSLTSLQHHRSSLSMLLFLLDCVQGTTVLDLQLPWYIISILDVSQTYFCFVFASEDLRDVNTVTVKAFRLLRRKNSTKSKRAEQRRRHDRLPATFSFLSEDAHSPPLRQRPVSFLFAISLFLPRHLLADLADGCRGNKPCFSKARKSEVLLF